MFFKAKMKERVFIIDGGVLANYPIATFGDKEEFYLSEFSHLFPEWKRFEDEINNPLLPNRYKEEISDFFEPPEKDVIPFNRKKTEKAKIKYNYNKSIQSSLSK